MLPFVVTMQAMLGAKISGISHIAFPHKLWQILIGLLDSHWWKARCSKVVEAQIISS